MRRAFANRVDASTKSKYGAVRTKVDGVTFASKAEARRYGELKMLEKAGEITDLRLQPKFPLHARGNADTDEPIKIGAYVADFAYERDDELVVEDVKGFFTDLAKWKIRHVQVQYGITVELVK